MIDIIKLNTGTAEREIKEVAFTGSELESFDEFLELLWWNDLYGYVTGNNELVAYDSTSSKFYYIEGWNHYDMERPYVSIVDTLNNGAPVSFTLITDSDDIEELSAEWGLA